MKEMGLSGPKWTSAGWPSLAVGGATTGAMPREWPSSQVATTTAGERLGDRHMPGGRRPLGPANGGVTEDRGQDVWRIKEGESVGEVTHNPINKTSVWYQSVCIFGAAAAQVQLRLYMFSAGMILVYMNTRKPLPKLDGSSVQI